MDDLFSREGGWRARSRCIGEGLGKETAERALVGFGGSKRIMGRGPARTPATDGFGRSTKLERDLLVRHASRSREHDLDATDQGLGRAVLPEQALKERLLLRTDSNGYRAWTGHDSLLSRTRDSTGTGCRFEDGLYRNSVTIYAQLY